MKIEALTRKSEKDLSEQHRLIGFFDILGFRNFVLDNPLNDIIDTMHKIFDAAFRTTIRHDIRKIGYDGFFLKSRLGLYDKYKRRYVLMPVLSLFEKTTKFKFVIMSDSIVIYSPPLKSTDKIFPTQVNTLIRISRNLITHFFLMQIPIRGSLSFGEYYADPENAIYCGKGLIGAYNETENQNWMGITITKSLENYLSPLLLTLELYLSKTRGLKAHLSKIKFPEH